MVIISSLQTPRRSIISNELNKEDIALLGLLKASAKKKDLRAGTTLHNEIRRKGLLEKNPYLATTLISLYSKCGVMSKAQQVLEEIPFRDVASWNALISGYTQQGQGHKALNCFKQMQNDGITPNMVTFICILKACASTKAIEKGKQIHDDVANRGILEKDIVLATALVDMYAKCGALEKALEVLEETQVRNVFLWSALIAGYAQHRQCHEALHCLERMQREGISPNEVTFICILKACGSTKSIEKGKKVHDDIVIRGLLETDIVLGNTLVDMYSKCGILVKAHEVLESLPVRDVVSWNALISGYVQHGQYYEALQCFEYLQTEGLFPDAVTFICILKSCGSLRDIEKGTQVHDKILSMNLILKDIVLSNALVDMYAKCGALAKALEVLKELHVRDIVSWNVIISSYAQQGQGYEALNCFEQMEKEGLSPDAITFLCILKACGSTGAIEKGQKFQANIRSRGLLEKDLALGNALVDMYVKFGSLMKAEQVLMELPIRSVVSWNSLISGYVLQNKGQEALKYFRRMQSEGIFPDEVTFICIAKACAIVGNIERAKQIHNEVMNRGFLEKDMGLGNALVDMYAKCGELAKAQEVLELIPVRDRISWNALIAGHAEQGQCDEAINCFEWMQSEGLSADEVTFICVLKACASTGATDKGEKIHEEIISRGLLGKDIMLNTALVDMYAKCGVLEKAQQVLDEFHVRDVVSWNALIAGYAQHGQGYKALNCFERMQNEGLSPNEVTFVCFLNACSHSGLLEEAEMLFGRMTESYGITPSLEHHTCMVVAFGCAGQFDKAMSVIKVMPSSDYLAIWLALLGACRRWANVKLGKVSFDQAIQLDISCAEAYVLMANIFAACGSLEDADKIEAMRLKYAAWRKRENCVWVDARGNAHSFSVGDTNHFQSKAIHAKVKSIVFEMSQKGYHSNVHFASPKGNSNGQKQCGHCDMLAVACALINTYEVETIYVVDNMYMCEDCHLAISYVSKAEKRKILVRDRNRQHVFERGKCACGG